ncbi:PAS domain-containing protein [Sphingomonas sp. S2-65]|uniref:PAS domain-containing protein n=1 Tax=Sphingomonas sp. S2-65 TaxID=2903960 RepID=UPI001F23B965|nr:PAS domain-containing protein [Sphingomonas sp. S2-65]UYY59793.1 PAS domain-containing protein [Sphingomonas sp. S2-65]
MPNEHERLSALRRFNILDTPPEPHFDQIVALVQTICQVPIALISLVDEDRQWFKAKVGTSAGETGIDTSVCALAIRQRDIFQIEDLSRDPRTAAMSLVTQAPHIRFYAGVPLVTAAGVALGSLCAIDTAPRPGGLDAAQQDILRQLGQQVVSLLELRLALERREDALARSEAAREAEAARDRYRSIVDSAIDSAIFAFDEDGNVTSWNKGAETIFGWTENEMLGRSAERLFTPEDRAAGVPEHEMATARSQGRASDERWHLRKDGSCFYAHGALTPLSGTAGPGFVKALRDITDEHATRRALELSRERVAVATRAARLGTFDYRIPENLLEWDDRCRELFGLRPGTPVSYEEAFLRGVHPDDRARADADVVAALDASGPGTFETEYRTIGIEDGRLRYVSARGQAYFEDGQPLRLVGTVQDVTKERLAQLRVQETEERLRLAGRATNDAIWDWDLTADRVAWNEALHTAYGHQPEDVVPSGSWWIEQIHPEDRARVDHAIHEVIDGEGSDWIGEYRFRRSDGSYADVRDRGYVIRNEDGRAIRMVGAMLDQTERVAAERRMQASLEESAAELDRLWRFSPDLQAAISSDWVVREANAAWSQTLGFAPVEVEGATFVDLVHPEDRVKIESALAAMDADAAPGFAFEVRHLHRTGAVHHVAWVAAVSGNLVFLTGRDMTAERAQQETLRQTEEALRQAHKVEAVGQLTGSVAHDFNNLLTVIRGSVDLLRRPSLTEAKRVRYVDAIADTADRATRLTSQLLAFARRQTLEPEIFDAVASIGELKDMLGTLAGSRMEVRYAMPEAPCWVNADPSQFDTAIVNIAVNARDAMDGAGTLTITVEQVEALPAMRRHPTRTMSAIAISLQDTGSGIAADKIEHIFEPFFTTKSVGHGTGLGLSQVFGFAKQSGGEVVVDSAPGQGATFTLYLPQTVPPGGEDEVSAPVGRPLEAGACILVVEDNKEVGEFATSALAELGYGSHWVPTAEAALAELGRAAHLYDAVFTDVVMPGRSGLELADDIRGLYPALPIVLTSGYSHILAESGTRGFDLLRKPYSVDELARTLRSVSERTPLTAEPV